jgi:hypothetical protein
MSCRANAVGEFAYRDATGALNAFLGKVRSPAFVFSLIEMKGHAYYARREMLFDA